MRDGRSAATATGQGNMQVAMILSSEGCGQWRSNGLKRGPVTALTQAFIQHFNARDLDDLVEGVYLQRYQFEPALVMLVFEIARQGDLQALEVMRWAGEELGQIGRGGYQPIGSPRGCV